MSPPPVTFTKDAIIEAAFDVVAKKGIHKLSARNVAQKMNSSTAPIYSYFKSMAVLKNGVANKAMDEMHQYCIKPYTDRVFLNIGTGIALFAKDYKKVFQGIFLRDNKYKKNIFEFLNAMRDVMKTDPRFKKMPAKAREELFMKMWTFTFGLATMIAVGTADQETKEYIIETLLSMGGDIIGASLSKLAK